MYNKKFCTGVHCRSSPRADDKLTYVDERTGAGCSPPAVIEWTLPCNAHISTLIGRPGVRKGGVW